jgi:hypothetical protein
VGCRNWETHDSCEHQPCRTCNQSAHHEQHEHIWVRLKGRGGDYCQQY